MAPIDPLSTEDDLGDARGLNGYARANGGTDSVADRGSVYHPAALPRVLRIPAKQAVAHVNILVAGGAGLGKTTFIKQFLNEFVNEALVPHDGTQTPLEKFRKEGGPASLCTHLADAVTTVSGEYTVYYHITDTPGHGNINNGELKTILLNYVRGEKEAHFRIRLDRQNDGQQPVGDPLKEGRPDRLIDLCLYFIPPQCFGNLDLDFITELSKEVLVVPVCAKADAMTVDERVSFQQLIRERLTQEGVTFTSIEEEMKLAAKQIGLPSEGLQHRPPFVVVASNTYRQINGETKPVRVYPWGECVITDPLHSDFSLIKEFVTTTAFHKLRSAKKRMFHRYCRQRMAGGQAPPPATPNWHDSQASTPRSGAAARQPELDDNHVLEKQQREQRDQEEVARLTQELRTLREEADRQRAAPKTPEQPALAPRQKSGLFGRHRG